MNKIILDHNYSLAFFFLFFVVVAITTLLSDTYKIHLQIRVIWVGFLVLVQLYYILLIIPPPNTKEPKDSSDLLLPITTGLQVKLHNITKAFSTVYCAPECDHLVGIC